MEDYKRSLQLKILEIVKDIDKICKENNIEYYLCYGSCLGAVRHNGFIPWDDDFDIMLKYDDYKRFLKVCEDQLDKSKYFVQTMESDPYYYLSFAKIRNIKTTLIEEASKAPEEFEVNTTSGELVFYENVLGNLTGTSLNWTMDGKDYYIISDNLTNEELLKVASSTSVVSLTK